MAQAGNVVILKRDTSDGTGLTKDNVILRCGDCLHFKGSIHPAHSLRCSEEGIRPAASAPSCFTPNAAVFRSLAPDTMTQLAALVTTFSPQQCRVLMGLLKGSASLERMGLHFMQKVYFCTGRDALENYYSGFVLCVGVDKNVSIVGRDYLRANHSSVLASLPTSSLITSRKRFDTIKARLISEGKVRAPNDRLKKAMLKEDYEPPTLDTNPEALEAKANKVSKRERGGELFKIRQESGR